MANKFARLPQACATLALVMASTVCAAYAAPKVVTSIAPIHSITSAIMQDVGIPDLLIEQSASPHSTALRPSHAQALQAADLVVWVGPDLEPALVKPIDSLAQHALSLPLIETQGLELLALREGNNWEKHNHEGEDHDDDEHADHDGHDDNHDEHADHDSHDDDHDHGHKDNHIWLDPQNGIKIAAAIKVALSEMDPEHAAQYDKNEKAFVSRLKTAIEKASTQLADKSNKPFIVFHDAYHYFEKRFEVEAVGSVTLQPGVAPGAARVKEIRKKLKALNVVCILSEPQFSSAIIPVLTEGSEIKMGELDPIGKSLTLGPSLYPDLFLYNAKHLSQCLSAE